MFAEEVYVARRKRIAEALGKGVVLLPGSAESPMNYPDNPYPFRQDSSFLYFFGIDRPGLFGAIDVETGEERLFGDDPTLDDIVWTGPQTPVSALAEAVGVQRTADRESLGGFLAKTLAKGREVHTLPQHRPENVLELQRLLGKPPERLAAEVSVPLIAAVVAQRSIKSDEEVAEIVSAVEICHAMQTTAMRLAQPGMVEREVVGAIEGIVRAKGSLTSFPTILSVHGETLHNHHHENVMRAGDIVINDSGAESPRHYAADITRTFPVGGRFSERQKAVWAIVLAAQEAAIAAVKPGVPFRDVHRLACEALAAGLVALGLMKGDVAAAVRAGAHALFFPCGLGHLMGLDVHDMEGLGEDHVGYTETIRRNPLFGFCSLRLARALEPGFVITVEPGIYFIPELIDRWRAEKKHAAFIDYEAVEAYRDFGGMRVEDDLLVVEGGFRVLGPPIPKTVEEIEAACAG